MPSIMPEIAGPDLSMCHCVYRRNFGAFSRVRHAEAARFAVVAEGLSGPAPCSTKASDTNEISARQNIVTLPHKPANRFSPLQEPLFVEHIDPAVINSFDSRSSRPCEFC